VTFPSSTRLGVGSGSPDDATRRNYPQSNWEDDEWRVVGPCACGANRVAIRRGMDYAEQCDRGCLTRGRGEGARQAGIKQHT